MIDAAGDCLRLGWSVIPLRPRDKRPLLDAWASFQTTRASEDQVRSWWTEHPQANLGIVTGAISGLGVLDLDGPEGLASIHGRELPPTVTAKTPRGWHYYFRHPGSRIPNAVGLLPGVDVRGDGGYVVAPPSVNREGMPYTWAEGLAPDEHPLAEMPSWLTQALERESNRKEPVTRGDGKILEGQRNAYLASLAGAIRRKGAAEGAILAALLEENASRCQPPLEEREVQQIAASVARYDPAEAPGAQPTTPNIRETWEPPAPFHEFNLPLFPSEALPAWLRDYVEAEAQATQTPSDLAGMLALSVCAAACAKKLTIRVTAGYTEPLNLFTVVALPPGNRKSAVFRDVAAPLEEHEKAEVLRVGPQVAEAQTRYKIAEQALQKAQAKAAGAETGERAALVQDAADKARELASMQVPALPRFIVDDCSPEKLSSLLKEQGGRITCMSPEGDVFDLMAGRYSTSGAPNLGVYLKGHAGDSQRVDRTGRGSEFVEAPALTLGLAVQPEVLRGLMEKPGFRGRGLLGRFLYALPVSPLGRRSINPPPVPPEARATYHCNVLALLALSFGTDAAGNPEPHVLRLAPDALAELKGFEAWIEPQLAESGDLGNMADWAGKLVGAVARIAGILHAAENVTAQALWEVPVRRETVLRARRIGEYLIPHAQAAYSEMGANPDMDAARYVLGWIGRKGVRAFTKRDAYQGTKGRFRRVQALEPALALLVEHGFIRPAPDPSPPGKGRKPSQGYEVNPLAHNSHNTHKSSQAGHSEDSGNSGKGVARG